MQSPYDPELRAEIRQRMSPPNRESVAKIARSTGVNAQTIYSLLGVNYIGVRVDSCELLPI